MQLRLVELREDNDLTQEECAKIAYISKNSYIRYENNVRIPPADVICFLAEYYGTSADYLLGITDEIKPYSRRKNKK